jgi:hypothetical protein
VEDVETKSNVYITSVSNCKLSNCAGNLLQAFAKCLQSNSVHGSFHNHMNDNEYHRILTDQRQKQNNSNKFLSSDLMPYLETEILNKLEDEKHNWALELMERVRSDYYNGGHAFSSHVPVSVLSDSTSS